ncbi:hypothetical protein J057_00569 [Marinobacter nanhaiticus D15-8W]|uniref:Replication protein n=1 Tax=Marinobacter nanhaiticus D15-8W TaxID=626887 RepID=N6X7I8_9GAMM|nr:hypothetical protein [Marinobacter nanhaiticus]ENO17113.1 hypothetical protein J057_00569 [Marinobacter nanhaiticus D15-8W]
MADIQNRFSKMPRNWIATDRPAYLAHFVGQEIQLEESAKKTLIASGDVIAALKIYMLLVAMADDVKQQKHVGEGRVRTTYDEIGLYLKLSRAKIRNGLALLEWSNAIIRLEKKPLLYELSNYHPKNFYKLPKGQLYGYRPSSEPIALARFPNRGVFAMRALVLYLLILSVCQRDNNVSLILYSTMADRTGIPQNGIRQAIDHLVNHQMISVIRVTNEETLEAFGIPILIKGKGSPNAYLIHGLKGKAYQDRVNTMTNWLEAAKEASEGSFEDFF